VKIKNLKCDLHAQRCQTKNTEKDLAIQSEKIKGKKGKDY